MSKKTKKLIVSIIKIVFPAVVGWLEGDSHVIADAISNLILLF